VVQGLVDHQWWWYRAHYYIMTVTYVTCSYRTGL